MGNEFGTIFRVSTWGESHGGAVGAVVDGCPARLPLAETDLQPQLDRRRPGQSPLTTPRREPDQVRILSGVFEGRTLGTPLLLLVENRDARPGAYEKMQEVYRPSHADFTYEAKHGIRDWQGGGRASARETVGRVAAGAIAEKILRLAEGVEIVAYVKRIANLEARIAPAWEGIEGAIDPLRLTRKRVDETPVRCPDPETAARMIRRIERVRREGDSLGGVIEAVVRKVPAGLGEPVFDKLEADLAKAMLSLPATKGFEIGSGFAGTRLKGSEHNDAFVVRRGRIHTRTNRSGGVQGGISNGEPILFRVAFKPTATIRKRQETVDRRGRKRWLEARGRHDPCVLPRAVPLVEAMAALVLVDHWLRQLARTEAAERGWPRTP
jgi:chorismate synthase